MTQTATIELEEFTMKEEEARRMWRQYKKATRMHPEDQHAEDMRAIYNQLKGGRKIIDIVKVMKKAGLKRNKHPRLAIARADFSTVEFRFFENGDLVFYSLNLNEWGQLRKRDVWLPGAFAKCDWLSDRKYNERLHMGMAGIGGVTICPAIPADIRPKGSLGRYYILWEVEKWKPIPPRDPYLLRRLTPTMFVVLAGWELTELERSVIAGRMT